MNEVVDRPLKPNYLIFNVPGQECYKTEVSSGPPVVRHGCISEAKRGRIGLREKESAAAF